MAVMCCKVSFQKMVYYVILIRFCVFWVFVGFSRLKQTVFVIMPFFSGYQIFILKIFRNGEVDNFSVGGKKLVVDSCAIFWKVLKRISLPQFLSTNKGIKSGEIILGLRPMEFPADK